MFIATEVDVLMNCFRYIAFAVALSQLFYLTTKLSLRACFCNSNCTFQCI